MIKPQQEDAEKAVWMLVDNGSLKPASPLNLRCVAYGLSDRLGLTVYPVSVSHSHKIPVEDLLGQPAATIRGFVQEQYEAGKRHFTIVPFFFAAGGGIVELMLRRVKELESELEDIRFRVLPFLFDEKRYDCQAISRILAARVREQFHKKQMVRPTVVMVDHGSPRPQAAMVRNYIAGQLSVLLGTQVHSVIPASMERRPGMEYDFNEPLLENVLRLPDIDKGDLILSMLFLSPGRHAGEGGDVAQICDEACAENPKLRIYTTGLVGTHEDIVGLLYDRTKDFV